MKGNRGIVFIILFLLIVAIAAVAVMPIVMRGISYHAISEHEKALYLAESGLQYYIKNQLLNDNNWSDNGSVAKNFGGGSFAVVVTGPSPRQQGTITIRSTGTVPLGAQSFSRIVEETIVRQSQSPFNFAIQAGGSNGITVPLSGQAYTDSYDSSLGRYNVNGNIGDNGDVTTNGDISISGQAHIGGDASTGASGTFNNQSAVSGTISHTANFALSSVSVPTALVNLTAESAFSLNGQSTQTISGDHKYPSMTLSGQSVLTVVGPSNIYLTGSTSLTISGQAKFSIASSSTGPVVIYADGNVSASGQGITNDTYIPANFQLYGTGATVATYTFSGQSAMYGAVYAPNANMTLSGQGGLFGAFVGNDISLSGQSAIHFDEALKNISTPGGSGSSGSFIFQGWREIE